MQFVSHSCKAVWKMREAMEVSSLTLCREGIDVLYSKMTERVRWIDDKNYFASNESEYNEISWLQWAKESDHVSHHLCVRYFSLVGADWRNEIAQISILKFRQFHWERRPHRPTCLKSYRPRCICVLCSLASLPLQLGILNRKYASMLADLVPPKLIFRSSSNSAKFLLHSCVLDAMLLLIIEPERSTWKCYSWLVGVRVTDCGQLVVVLPPWRIHFVSHN